ncbi:MAG: class I SAM-dependent methyltransferase, partial [Methyloceanibacter sp.]
PCRRIVGPETSNDTTATVPCTVCGAIGAPYACSKSGYHFFRCVQCGFVFVDPMPTEEAFLAIYDKGYRNSSADFYPKARSRQWRTFWKALRFARFLIGKSALDIGCGGGFITHSFSRLGARAVGLDINESSIAYARAHFPDCSFFCEGFETFAKRGLLFDFVFSSEVMEHIPGTRAFMSLVAAVTKPGSHVYIATPDCEHETVPRNLADWDQVAPPEHVQLFNKRNMVALFEQYGFVLKTAFTKRSPALSLLFLKR